VLRRRFVGLVLTVLLFGWSSPVFAASGHGLQGHQEQLRLLGHRATAGRRGRQRAAGRAVPAICPCDPVAVCGLAGAGPALSSSGQGDCPFADEAQIPPADRPLVSAVVGAGIMAGVWHNLFDPMGNLTRAQAATVFGRELQKHGQVPDTRYFGATIPAWAAPAASAAAARAANEAAARCGRTAITRQVEMAPTVGGAKRSTWRLPIHSPPSGHLVS